jgi:hypothetical protein
MSSTFVTSLRHRHSRSEVEDEWYDAALRVPAVEANRGESLRAFDEDLMEYLASGPDKRTPDGMELAGATSRA